MTTQPSKPSFIGGRRNAVLLAACQIGSAFMAADAVAATPTSVAVAVLMPLACTVLLAWNLGAAAVARGRSVRWRVAAALSLIGVAIVYCLPNAATVAGTVP